MDDVLAAQADKNYARGGLDALNEVMRRVPLYNTSEHLLYAAVERRREEMSRLLSEANAVLFKASRRA